MFHSIFPRFFARPLAATPRADLQPAAPQWPDTEPAALDADAILGDFLLDDEGPAAHRVAMYAPTMPAALAAR